MFPDSPLAGTHLALQGPVPLQGMNTPVSAPSSGPGFGDQMMAALPMLQQMLNPPQQGQQTQAPQMQSLPLLMPQPQLFNPGNLPGMGGLPGMLGAMGPQGLPQGGGQGLPGLLGMF